MWSCRARPATPRHHSLRSLFLVSRSECRAAAPLFVSSLSAARSVAFHCSASVPLGAALQPPVPIAALPRRIPALALRPVRTFRVSRSVSFPFRCSLRGLSLQCLGAPRGCAPTPRSDRRASAPHPRTRSSPCPHIPSVAPPRRSPFPSLSAARSVAFHCSASAPLGAALQPPVPIAAPPRRIPTLALRPPSVAPPRRSPFPSLSAARSVAFRCSASAPLEAALQPPVQWPTCVRIRVCIGRGARGD